MPFTGKAVYDDGVFDDIAEDVADLIGIISPKETPLLDALPMAERPAQHVLHEWMEDALAPHTVTSSTAVASTTAASSVEVHDGAGGAAAAYLQVGDILEFASGEQVQISGISGNYLSLSRAFGGTSATSYDAGVVIDVVGSAALEGADVSVDTSRPRTRRQNYCQLIKKDVIISGTARAMRYLGGVSDEFELQKAKKVAEALRDLERLVIRGRTSGNSLGSASNYRTMDGLLARITTNVTSTGTLTPSILNDIVKSAWNKGGQPDLIVADANWKALIDQFNATDRRVMNKDEDFHQKISVYESTFGLQRVMLNRWMPANTLLVLDSSKVKVVPLQGRSFRVEGVAKTGDADKAMVLGEYTLEIWNEDAMAAAHD